MRGTAAGQASTRTRASVLRPAADRAVNLLGVGLKLLLAQLEVSRSSAPSCPPSPAPPGCPMPDSWPTTLPAVSPGATVVVLLGYAASASYTKVEKAIGRGSALAVLVVVLAALLGWRIRKHHAERNAEQP